MLTLQQPILAAAVAFVGTALVLLLYVLKLRRRPIRVSTTAFFSAAVDDLEANVPWRRLRPSWMLLLHLLILWALALALGRPVWQSSSSRTDLIIVLDHSASMLAQLSRTAPADSTIRLDQAKAIALSRGNETLSSGGRVALLTAAARTQTTLPISTSRAALSAAVTSIMGVEQPARLDLAIDAARSLAATLTASQASSPSTLDASLDTPSSEAVESAAESARRTVRILLITDGVSPISVDRAQGIDIATLPAQTNPDNLGIVSIVARRTSETSAQTQVLIRIINSSNQARIAPLRIDADGKTQQRLTLNIPAATRSADGAFTPGSTQHTLALTLPGEAVISAHLTRPDILTADDAVWTLIPPPKPRRILLVSAASESDLGSQMLRDVLQEIVTDSSGGDPRAPTAGEVISIPLSRLASLVDRDFADYSLAIFDRVEPPARFPIGVLSFGVRAALATEPAKPSPPRPTRPLWWDRASPVLDDNPIDTILIRQSLPIINPAAEARVLARGTDGPLILYRPRTPAAPPRLAVLFAISESNWPLHVSFPIFIARATELLSPDTSRGTSTSYSTADSITLGIPSSLSSGTITLRSGTAASAPQQFPITPGQTELTFVPIDRVGIYQLSQPLGPANSPVTTLAINLAASNVSALHSTLNPQATPGNSTSISGPRSAEWWRVLVIIAAVLLLVEWLLFAWLQRRSAA